MGKSVKRIVWIIWLVAIAWGLYGVSLRLFRGELHVNYGSYIPWGLWVAAKVYIVGLGVGTSLFAWIVYAFDMKKYLRLAREALLVSAIALAMGMLVIAFDLGHMWRALEPLYRPQFRSLLAWSTWLAIIDLLYIIVVLSLVIGTKREIRAQRVLGWIGIFLGVAFSGCNGAEFASLVAHPYWNSTLGPILSINGDLLSGFALVLILAACFYRNLLGDDERSLALLSRVVLGLIISVLVLQWSEYSISAWYGVGQETPLHLKVLFGSSWYLFWIGQLLIGSIIPAVLFLWRPASRAAAGIGGLLVAAAYFVVRYILVISGQTTPTFPELQAAYTDHRLTFAYSPSSVEWSVVVFCLAFGVGIFFLSRRLIPFVELHIFRKGGE
ncbi:MAG: NrfD/PsrC family molybdoenzyme membrane anchor subunit [Desulfatiglandaceae bacterium]